MSPCFQKKSWIITYALQILQLEIRILEESMQRKDVAVKVLKRKLKCFNGSWSPFQKIKDYNELRDLQLIDYVEQESSFLREFERKLMFKFCIHT